MVGVPGPKPPATKYGQQFAPNLNVRHLCPNCRTDPPNIIEEYSKGDLVCGDCGTILGDRIVDTRSEWRTFAGDEKGGDPSRVGDAGNALLGSNNLDTVISGRDGNTGLSVQLQRAQLRNNSAKVPGKGSSVGKLASVFGRISEKCEQMSLPRAIAERAQHVYKIADEKRVVRNKNETVIIAACIIFACRDGKVDRTFQDLHKAMKVTKKDLFHVCTEFSINCAACKKEKALMCKTFNLVKAAVYEDRSQNGENATTGVQSLEVTVDGILTRITHFLALENYLTNAAKYISVLAIDKADVIGRSPNSIATGILYFTVTLFSAPVTVGQISEVGDVSPSTIKLICKMVSMKIDDVIKPQWKTEHVRGYNILSALGRVDPRSVAGTPRNGGTPAPASENGEAATPQPTA